MIQNLLLALPLGINFQSILLHLLNLILLIVILGFLVYKPVKNFMDSRRQKIENIENDLKQRELELEQEKLKCQKLMKDAEIQIENNKILAQKEIEYKNKKLIEDAKNEAKAIVLKAEEQSNQTRETISTTMRNEISDAIINITKAILDREVSLEDNEKLIEKSLKEWSQE